MDFPQRKVNMQMVEQCTTEAVVNTLAGFGFGSLVRSVLSLPPVIAIGAAGVGLGISLSSCQCNRVLHRKKKKTDGGSSLDTHLRTSCLEDQQADDCPVLTWL